MELVKKEDFNGYNLDVFGQDSEYYLTRRQIGEALEYDQPIDAIKKIHKRNKERMNRFVVIVPGDNLSPGVNRNDKTGRFDPIYYYSFLGVIEICRHSRQPKAIDLTDKIYNIMFMSVSDSQKMLQQAKAHIADLSEANTRLNLQYQQQHQERKQLKDHAAKLEAVAKLQETPAGMIAADFLKALNKAVSGGTYAIIKAQGKTAVDGLAIGVYDRNFLYIPAETAADIYNEFALIKEITPGELVRNLEQARIIKKRMPGKDPRRTIDGVKRECVAVYLGELRKVMEL